MGRCKFPYQEFITGIQRNVMNVVSSIFRRNTVHIPEHLIRGLNENTRPFIVYRHDDGNFKCGYVLRSDEFVASLASIRELAEAAGLMIVEQRNYPI